MRLRAWLVSMALCGCVALPHRAVAAELKVATWNLEWLTLRAAGDPVLPRDVQPKDAADRATLGTYATQLNADVVALQEVDGPTVAATLFPPDRYALFFTHDAVVQRVGVAVRRGIPVQQNPDLTALDVTPDAPFRLRSGADLTLDLPSGPLRVLALHLKTGCQRDRFDHTRRAQCAILRNQAAVLQGWMDAGSLRVLVYREGADRKEHLSDHCPVSVRFHLPG